MFMMVAAWGSAGSDGWVRHIPRNKQTIPNDGTAANLTNIQRTKNRKRGATKQGLYNVSREAERIPTP